MMPMTFFARGGGTKHINAIVSFAPSPLLPSLPSAESPSISVIVVHMCQPATSFAIESVTIIKKTRQW
jgi:hypothetical protein